MAMREKCYLGVDLGLSRTKAAAFDATGHQLAIAELPSPRVATSATRHEIDMDGLARDVRAILRELTGHLDALGYSPAGLGVTGSGNGLYAADEDLRPVGPGIASSDGRARRYITELSVETGDSIHAVTGSRPWAGQPLPLLRWLLDERPEMYQKIRWAFSSKDWIVTTLTGVPSADYSDASASGILNLAYRRPSRLPIRALDLPSDVIELFGSPMASGRVTGSVTAAVSAATGLPPGLPVIAGCMDCVASTLGIEASGAGDVVIITGTWAINGVVVPTASPPSDIGMVALLPDPTHMLCLQVSPASASNLDWLATAMGAGSHPIPLATLLDEAASVPPGADGLVYLPFINGSGNALPASGTFVGAAASHRRGHLVRAVLEGVAQFHRIQLEQIVGAGLANLDRPWRLTGGGAQSPLWAQIFADVIGHSLLRRPEREFGALGVASLAAQSLGVAKILPVESDPLVVEPGPGRHFYRWQAEVFDSILAGMQTPWAAAASLISQVGAAGTQLAERTEVQP